MNKFQITIIIVSVGLSILLACIILFCGSPGLVAGDMVVANGKQICSVQLLCIAIGEVIIAVPTVLLLFLFRNKG